MAKKFSDENVSLNMPEWDQMALQHMKVNQKGESLGVSLSIGAAADEWERYFKARGMRNKASFLRQRVNAGQGYTVPTEWPDQYDGTWLRKGGRGRSPYPED